MANRKRGDYGPGGITLALIRQVSKWPAPGRPREIRDSGQKLILRHQPSGYMALYVQISRTQRERLCSDDDIGNILDSEHPATFAQIKRQARILLGESASGRDFTKERKTKRQIPTFRQALSEKEEGSYAEYVTYSAQDTETAKHRDGTGTLNRLRACFLKQFGNDKLDAITATELDKWRRRRRREGVKPETIRRDVTALHALLEWYAKPPRRILTEHPLDGYEHDEIDSSKKVRRAFEEEEERAVMQAAEEREEAKRTARARANQRREQRGYALLPSLDGGFVDWLLPAILIARHTGLRRNEQFSLDWQQVDLRKGEIRVEGAKTKSYETRIVPLNSVALSTLRKWNMQQGRPTTGPVFGHTNGSRLKKLNRSFYKVLADADIERISPKGSLTWHSWRHTFGSRLGKHTDAETLRDLMGHADIATTQKYLHSEDQRRRAAVEDAV